jgi:hypothetical protein
LRSSRHHRHRERTCRFGLTHERIRGYAAANPTVYLVARDPETGTRLAERQLVHPAAVKLAA